MSALRHYWWILGLAIAAIVVVVLAPLASADPDGLGAVAGAQGFLSNAKSALYSIIPNYAFPGVDDPATSKILAGLVGVIIVASLMYLIGRSLARRKA